ncbi:IS66 family transposase [Teredinibacter turnerae]|uniref:IS66 family transposase n=1 Tax=Teredinibacter turnerae TaxID=2426 RepID=UPI00039E64DA|nr:transposase [Teredinibacter turnerae]
MPNIKHNWPQLFADYEQSGLSQTEFCLHLDETPLQVLDEPGKTAQSKSYMWVMAHVGEQPACIFHYADSCGQQIPLNLLSAENTAIMVDGYEGYQKACDDYVITRLGWGACPA